MTRLHRLGTCSRCGASWISTSYYVWAAGTLSAWLCRGCVVWTRMEQRKEA